MTFCHQESIVGVIMSLLWYYVLSCPLLCALDITFLFLFQKNQSGLCVIIKPIREWLVSKSYIPVASVSSALKHPGKDSLP